MGDKELHYRGPLHLRSGGLDQRVTRANVVLQSNASTSVTGKINGFWISSDVTSCTDWSSFANVYQEYRVVGLEVKWFNRYNDTYSATVTPGYGAQSVWHTPVVPTPTSTDEVLQNANNKLWNTNRPLTMEWRARGTEEMVWTPITSTSSHGGIQYYAENAIASTNYGMWVVTFCVEFRGRK